MGHLIVIFLLLFGSAFFSASELAVMGTPLYKIKQALNNGISRYAKLLLKLRTNPERTLITILIGNNLINVILSIYASRLGDSVLKVIGIVGAIGFFFISFSITFLILLFGEIIPKIFATRFSLRFALIITPILNFITYILFPIVYLLELLILLLSKIIESQYEKVSRDDVEIFVEDGKKQGIFSNTESMIIKNLLDFNERTVESVLRHRTEMFALPFDMTLKEAVKLCLTKPYSRIPVYRNDKDKVIGLITIRDILNLIQDKENLYKEIGEFGLRHVFKIPMTADIMDVFLKMKRLGRHFAIVIDERGGTQGMVTFEDILEDMVGDIIDESDINEEKEIERLSDTELLVKGEVIFRDILREFDLDNFRIPDDLSEDISENDMVSYIILIVLKHFAKKGENVTIGKLFFKVLETNISEDKILKVSVSLVNENE